MSKQDKAFASRFLEHERYRTYRNRWLSAGLGGVALFGVAAAATEGGLRGIFLVAAAGTVLGAEVMALDAQTAVSDTRRQLNSMAHRATEQVPQLIEEPAQQSPE